MQHGCLQRPAPAKYSDSGQRGSCICPQCLRVFRSSSARLRHCKAGCPFASSHAAARLAASAFCDPPAWAQQDQDAYLRRCVEESSYAGLCDMVLDAVSGRAGSLTVRAHPARLNGHLEVFDGSLWVRAPKRRVLTGLLLSAWARLNAFWGRNRASLLYSEDSPIPPELELEIDLALSVLGQEVKRAMEAAYRTTTSALRAAAASPGPLVVRPPSA